MEGNQLLVVLIIFLGALFILCHHYLVTGFILRKRISAFKDFAKEFSLKHSYVSSTFFIPYGKLNSLQGDIKGHSVEIFDSSDKPGTIETFVAVSPGVSSNKILSMNTKIFVDGKEVTPNYPQKWTFYKNSFMEIADIKEYLEKI